MILSRGIRQTTPRKRCRKDLHVLTPANTMVAKDGTLRCRACRENSLHKYRRARYNPHPSDTGKCENGLHPWVPENWTVDSVGNTRCKECRRRAQRDHYHRTKQLKGRRHAVGVRRLMCIVAKCRSNSKSNHVNYICPKHRRQPPEWIREHYKIVGTEIVWNAGSSQSTIGHVV